MVANVRVCKDFAKCLKMCHSERSEESEYECRKVRKVFFNRMRKLLKMRIVSLRKPR